MDTIQNNSGQKNLGQKNITKRTGIKKPMSAELMSADMHLSVPGVQTAEVSPDLDECIRLCWQARHTVQRTLVEHCLSKGGKYVGPTHVQSMLDCMDICQAAADFMTRGSPLHTSVCAAAANVADACADSCESMQPNDATADGEMQRCADICRACAIACRDMAQQGAAIEDLHIDRPPTLAEEFPSIPT
ncbi:MAG: four-helix bundle copper-binding protein [Micavibrio sp.]|nr:four-helix bundle copper-binding protein [Micavibrio sp.]